VLLTLVFPEDATLVLVFSEVVTLVLVFPDELVADVEVLEDVKV
jgi:hypothetical protein